MNAAEWLERVELQLALADTDVKFEKVLDSHLLPVLDKLQQPQLQSKVIDLHNYIFGWKFETKLYSYSGHFYLHSYQQDSQVQHSSQSSRGKTGFGLDYITGGNCSEFPSHLFGTRNSKIDLS
jgi:hypothetical protein